MICFISIPSSHSPQIMHPDRGKAGGALVFSDQLWLIYALGLYTYQKIHRTKLGFSNSTVESCFVPLAHYIFSPVV